MAEQATGCRQNRNGLGTLYAGPINRNGMVSEPGHELTPQEAQDWLYAGGSVAIPNAGAGSYREAFKLLGFSKVEAYDQTSSAGDWTFRVHDDQAWYYGFQSNRWPRCGFEYSVNFDEPSAA